MMNMMNKQMIKHNKLLQMDKKKRLGETLELNCMQHGTRRASRDQSGSTNCTMEIHSLLRLIISTRPVRKQSRSCLNFSKTDLQMSPLTSKSNHNRDSPNFCTQSQAQRHGDLGFCKCKSSPHWTC